MTRTPRGAIARQIRHDILETIAGWRGGIASSTEIALRLSLHQEVVADALELLSFSGSITPLTYYVDSGRTLIRGECLWALTEHGRGLHTRKFLEACAGCRWDRRRGDA